MSNDIKILIRQAKRNNKQELNLSSKELESVPKDVYGVPSLISLNLSYNNLTDMDREIENLKNLRELDLSNNNITDLPIEIISLPMTLKLNNNPIIKYMSEVTPTNWKNQLKHYLLDKMKGGGGLLCESNNLYDFKATEDELYKSKRDWMKETTNMSKTMSMGASSVNTNFNVNSNMFNVQQMPMMDKTNTGDKISELESALQKEELNNKRMKKEIERLTAMQNNSSGINISNKNSDFLLKSIVVITS